MARVCKTCRERRLGREFPTARSKSCKACHAEVPKCRNCGEPSGFASGLEPRKLCDACLPVVKAANRSRGRDLYIARLRERKERRCPWCDKVKKLDRENYSPAKVDESGEVVRWDAYCRACRRLSQRLFYHFNKGYRERALRRAKVQREQIRGRSQADPEYARERRELERRWERERRERLRHPPQGEGRPDAAAFPDLPEAPVVAFLHRRRGEGTIEAACEALGIPPRTLWRWEHSPGWSRGSGRGGASFDLVDSMLARAGLLWWEVYDPQLAPGLYTPLQWIDVIDAASQAFDGERLIGGETHG